MPILDNVQLFKFVERFSVEKKSKSMNAFCLLLRYFRFLLLFARIRLHMFSKKNRRLLFAEIIQFQFMLFRRKREALQILYGENNVLNEARKLEFAVCFKRGCISSCFLCYFDQVFVKLF